MKVAVSILSSDYDEETTIKKINQTDAEYLHLDIMDGHFVMNKTPEHEYLNESEKPIDVHLMVSRPFEYISKLAALAQTSGITIHVELEDDLTSLLKYIKSFKKECGLAINPSTSVDALKPYLNLVDIVLVMSVEPGKGNQEMIEGCTNKIDELIKLRMEHGYKFKIIVDGGVNDKTIKKVELADVVVSGVFICKSEDYQSKINQLRLSNSIRK